MAGASAWGKRARGAKIETYHHDHRPRGVGFCQAILGDSFPAVVASAPFSQKNGCCIQPTTAGDMGTCTPLTPSGFSMVGVRKPTGDPAWV